MLLTPTTKPFLVSVIITCYNHGQYLAAAIESALEQNYRDVEIIVIDDGSTDNTKCVSEHYPKVKYIYQANQGLSAARNTGIENSTGEFIVFLDADDWLLPDAISSNLFYLEQNQELAFVSGSHEMVFAESGEIVDKIREVNSDHYLHLLHGNYIGMHGTVMFRRWVFDEFSYDTTLKACEDYDIYLKISRKYSVHHHTKKVAAYRIYKFNMSNNIPMMLETALLVLKRQQKFLVNSKEKKSLRRGLNSWKDYYHIESHNKSRHIPILNENNSKAKKLDTSRTIRDFLYSKHFTLKLLMNAKLFIKRVIPDFILLGLYKTGIYKGFVPSIGKINLGDLNRTTPFNTVFGYNRGGPVDRYYIENFLQQQAGNIKGRVLEIGGDEYTLHFGGSKVIQSDILHIDDKNPKATFVGDLSDAPHLPADSFDCIILTQTLHLIYSYKEALETCYRILKPGGTLLLTVPGISHIDQGDWKRYWFWSFTESSITRLLSEIFPAENVNVETYGNVLVATAFLYGIGLPEIKKEQMDYNDPHYQVIICASAVKPN